MAEVVSKQGQPLRVHSCALLSMLLVQVGLHVQACMDSVALSEVSKQLGDMLKALFNSPVCLIMITKLKFTGKSRTLQVFLWI
jgi:hypothetical protein